MPLRPAILRLLSTLLLSVASTPALAWPESDSDGPASLEQGGDFAPLWQAPGALSPNRRSHGARAGLAPFVASALPEDAAWEGFVSPASNGNSSMFVEVHGKLVLATGGVAGSLVSSLVTWDGTQFEALPSLEHRSPLALGVWNGELIVAVYTGLSANFPILRLNGAVWDTLGIANDYIFALGEYQGRLIVGGRQTMVSGVATSIVAAYDGNTWAAAGTGLSSFQVTGLTTHAGSLVAVGSIGTPFSGVASLGALGSAWQPVGAGFAGGVYSTVSDGTHLYAVGRLTSSGGVTMGGLARWDGSIWNSTGGPTNLGASEQRATHWNNRIVATFRPTAETIGGLSQWDGFSLTSLPGDSIGFGIGGGAARVGTWGSKLVVTGNFSTNGSVPVPKILLYDGAQWSTVALPWSPAMTGPTTGFVTNMWSWGGKLIVAGQFPLVADQDHWVNHVGISAWDGAHWSPLGNGLGAQWIYFGEYQGDLIAAGYTFSVRGTSITKIARWNGSAWSALGTGAPEYIQDLATFQGELYVASYASPLTKWNGSTWTPLPGSSGGEYGLAASGSRLVAGGNFSNGGGIVSPNVAFWNGASWEGAGAGVNNIVWAAADWLGQPVIGGLFTASGGTPLSAAARWDGAAWQPMGTRAVEIYVLRVLDGELFASGDFKLPDDSVVNTIAHWTGTDWHVLGSGVSGYGYFFSSYGDHLYHAGVGLVHGHASHGLSRVPLTAVLDAPRPKTPGAQVTLAAHPNPSRGPVHFTLTLPTAGRARVTVTDLAGRVIATPVDRSFDAGVHQASWTAAAPAGIYFVRLDAPGGARRVVRVARFE